MNLIPNFFAAVLLLLVSTSSLSASFNCSKASSFAEKTICADNELSRLDDELGVAFKEAYEKSSDKVGFKKAALEEWKLREKICQDRECLSKWYQRRLSETRSFSATPTKLNHTPPKVLSEKESSQGSGRNLQYMGKLLGFDIPLTEAEFLQRYATIGGQCGAKHAANDLIKELAPSVNIGCVVSPCPNLSPELNCRLIRTGFDKNGELVLFILSLKEKATDRLKQGIALGGVGGPMTERAGKSPEFRDVPNGIVVVQAATEGKLQYEFRIIETQTEPPGGVFWISKVSQ